MMVIGESELSSITGPGIDPSVLRLMPLRQAAKALSIRQTTIRQFLSRHRKTFPPLYRVDPGCKRRVRYLTEHELSLVREGMRRRTTTQDTTRAETLSPGSEEEAVISNNNTGDVHDF